MLGRAPGPSEPVDLASITDLLATMRRWSREHGDLVPIATTDGETALVVCRPDLVRQVLVTHHDRYTKGWGIDRVRLLLGEGLMVAEGDRWREHRALVQPLFHRRMLDRLAERFAVRARAVRDRWVKMARAGEVVDVTAETSEFALEAIVDALGLTSCEGTGPFSILAGETRRDFAFAKRVFELRGLVGELLDRKRALADREPDLSSMLLDAPWSRRQLVDEVLTLVVAGHETTAAALAWVWYLLASHPEAEARLHEELAGEGSVEAAPFCDQVIREALRMYPPGWLVTRRAAERDRFGDVVVEAGTHVLVPIFSLHRHPDHWTDPERFLPERFAGDAPPRHPFAWLPFAAGPRRCIGEAFAMLEMRCHVVEIARAVRFERVDAGEVPLEARVNLRAGAQILLMPCERMHA